ncbi:MAG TPA: fumarylacetoacetate hydrolase family protein [Nitrospiraceae bacterium]|jgi:2-keto-4-pentenoate hydratase
MTPVERIQAAAQLVLARSATTRLEALTDTWPDLSADDGYAIQNAFVAASRVSADEPLAGFKILLSREDLQRRFSTSEPAYGQLLFRMVLKAGATVDVAGPLVTHVEPEVAFIMGTDLSGPAVTDDEILEATAYVVAALELPQGRMEWKANLGNVLADNGGARLVVVGSETVQANVVDLAALRVRLLRNGQLVGEGSTANVLGNPVKAMAWLCKRLNAEGRHLQAGQIVMTGSCMDAIAASTGDVVAAEFDGLGSVSVQFA